MNHLIATAVALTRDRWRIARSDDRGATAIEWAIFALLALWDRHRRRWCDLVGDQEPAAGDLMTAATCFCARSIALAAAEEGVEAQRAYIPARPSPAE